nr:MAG TPA: hypothetical protein [Caudoviricetes sp.]
MSLDNKTNTLFLISAFSSLERDLSDSTCDKDSFNLSLYSPLSSASLTC